MRSCGCNGIERAKARHLLCVARAIGDQQIPKMVIFALPVCVALHREPTLVRSASRRLRGRLIDSPGLGFRKTISHAVTGLYCRGSDVLTLPTLAFSSAITRRVRVVFFDPKTILGRPFKLVPRSTACIAFTSLARGRIS